MKHNYHAAHNNFIANQEQYQKNKMFPFIEIEREKIFYMLQR